MPDLTPLLHLLALAYGAALTGHVAALLARLWTVRGDRLPSLPEATWSVFLPLLAMFLVPLFTVLQPHTVAPLSLFHGVWHRWEAAAHAVPVLHGSLHFANALLLLAGVFCAARAVYQLSRMRAFQATLRRCVEACGSAPDAGRVHRLPVEKPACFTVGVFRPAVYLTAGLLEHLSEREQEAVLAHEMAHVRRRDGLLRALLSLFYGIFPLPGSRVLLRDWSRAVERRCDADAARAVGSATEVAAALVRVARLGTRSPVEPCLSAFAGEDEDVEGRVLALLAPTPAERSVAPRRLLLAAATLVLLFLAAFPLRHLVEFFIRH